MPASTVAWVVPPALLLVPLTPLMARRGTRQLRTLALLAALGLVVLGLAWTVASPRATLDRPAQANLLVVQDGASGDAWAHLELPRAARAGAATLPAAFIDAFERVAGPTGGVLPTHVDGSSPLPRLAALAPEVAVARDPDGVILTIRSRRQAAAALVCSSGDVALQDGTVSRGYATGSCGVVHRIAPEGRWPLVLRLRPAATEVTVWVADETIGAPPEAHALVAARGDSVVPWQRGDRTIVGRAVHLGGAASPADPGPSVP
jgi:hypothetical protein